MSKLCPGMGENPHIENPRRLLQRLFDKNLAERKGASVRIALKAVEIYRRYPAAQQTIAFVYDPADSDISAAHEAIGRDEKKVLTYMGRDASKTSHLRFDFALCVAHALDEPYRTEFFREYKNLHCNEWLIPGDLPNECHKTEFQWAIDNAGVALSRVGAVVMDDGEISERDDPEKLKSALSATSAVIEKFQRIQSRILDAMKKQGCESPVKLVGEG